MNTQKPAAYRAKMNDLNAIFDVRGFLIKLLRFWPVFILSLGIAYSYAYYISVRKLPVYYMENTISIKDDQNPFLPAIRVLPLIGVGLQIKSIQPL